MARPGRGRAMTTQQAARAGATGRGATDFVGPYDYAPGGGS